jgi:Leucine-rich repeat (LRR) protein
VSTVDIAGLRVDTSTRVLELDAIKRRLKTLPDLSALTKLRRLEVRGHSLASLDGIEACPRLRFVDLEARVKDLSALANAKQLEFISVSSVTLFEALPALPRITSISAFHAGVKSLANINRFRALQILNIDRGTLTGLAALGALKKLVYVSAREHGLRSLKGLPSSLETLHVEDNGLTSLDGIDRLTNLEELFLDDNRLTRIPDLSKLKKLQTLSLLNNRITRLENLERLHALRSLTIDGDDMTSVSAKTAAWLRERPTSFKLHSTPRQMKTKPDAFLATTTIS